MGDDMTEYKSTPRGILKLEIAFSEILDNDQACVVLNAFEKENEKLREQLGRNRKAYKEIEKGKVRLRNTFVENNAKLRKENEKLKANWKELEEYANSRSSFAGVWLKMKTMMERV